MEGGRARDAERPHRRPRRALDAAGFRLRCGRIGVLGPERRTRPVPIGSSGDILCGGGGAVDLADVPPMTISCVQSVAPGDGNSPIIAPVSIAPKASKRIAASISGVADTPRSGDASRVLTVSTK